MKTKEVFFFFMFSIIDIITVFVYKNKHYILAYFKAHTEQFSIFDYSLYLEYLKPSENAFKWLIKAILHLDFIIK